MHSYLHAVRACVAVVLLGLCPAVGGCAGEDEGIEFPYRMVIAPGNVLFIHGHEFRNEVWVTWEPGDSVRINGLPVLPVPQPPPKQFSEEDLADLYGDVPFIVDLVEQGATWREAADEYGSRMDAFGDRARRVYRRVFEATGSKDEATEAVLDFMDRELLDPAFEIRHGDGDIVVKREGLPGEGFYFLHNDYMQSLVETKPREPLGEQRANAFVESIARRLEGRVGGIWMEVFSNCHITLMGGSVKKALKQIEDAEQGKPSAGPLPDPDVRLIVRVRGGVQK